MQSPKLDIVGCFANEINEEGNIYSLRTVPIENSDIHKYIWTNPIIHPSVMFERSPFSQLVHTKT